MIQGVAIIIVFFIIAGLMMSKKLPTSAALPILAIMICVISGVPLVGQNSNGEEIGILKTVVEDGSIKLASPMMAVIFGAWLGQLLNKTGVTELMIKKSAELGGDKPLLSTLLLALVTGILFTTLNGLGSIIMVGSIVLPILLSVGVEPLSAAMIFLMSFSTGLTFNVANWKMFASIFNIDIEQIKHFAIYMFALTFIATIVMILIEFKRNGVRLAASTRIGNENKLSQQASNLKGIRSMLAMLTPFIPIILVAIFKVPVISSFIIGIFWILIVTSNSYTKSINLFVRTCYDGITDSAPALIVMVGIGMLFLAVTHPMLKEVLNPFLLAVIPAQKWFYVLFFAILAPLSLYRGPLNLFGLGSGIAALIIGLNTLPSLSVMGAFLSSERIQSCADPTNTQNVWTANFMEVEVNSLTKRMLPYLWSIAALGVLISAVIYF